ncbi:hypothetical protein TNCV_845501, partial [Trichonephila clavipes]
MGQMRDAISQQGFGVLSVALATHAISLMSNLLDDLRAEVGACMLKRIQKNPVDGDNFSTSDSNTYYEDDFSSSEDSSDETDDDSEPILGQWFEETLAPPEPQAAVPAPSATTNEAESNNTKSQQPPQPVPENNSLIPDKGEPNG